MAGLFVTGTSRHRIASRHNPVTRFPQVRVSNSSNVTDVTDNIGMYYACARAHAHRRRRAQTRGALQICRHAVTSQVRGTFPPSQSRVGSRYTSQNPGRD